MNKIDLFKKIDKIIGTPLCVLLGAWDRIISKKDDGLSRPKRILVIKLVAIGDLVLTLPTLRALKKSFPESYLAILVTPRVREVVEGCRYLDKIIYYDILGKDGGFKGFFRLIHQLRGEKFDLVIELDHYYRITTLVSYFSKIENRLGFDLPGQGRRWLYTAKVPYLVDKHEVEVFLETAKKVGADISEKELVEISVLDKDKEYVNNLFRKVEVNDKNFLVGIHLGSGSSAASRRWSVEKFGELANWLVEKYNARLIFTGTSSEKSLIDESVGYMNFKPIIIAGKTNLKQFAEIVRRCKIFIGVDTGPLHIAAAMKTKVVGLYGPNTPSKWGPYGKGHITIYKSLDCSPCTKQYLGKISKCKDPICMEKILVDDVKRAIVKVLAETT